MPFGLVLRERRDSLATFLPGPCVAPSINSLAAARHDLITRAIASSHISDALLYFYYFTISEQLYKCNPSIYLSLR